MGDDGSRRAWCHANVFKREASPSVLRRDWRSKLGVSFELSFKVIYDPLQWVLGVRIAMLWMMPISLEINLRSAALVTALQAPLTSPQLLREQLQKQPQPEALC